MNKFEMDPKLSCVKVSNFVCIYNSDTGELPRRKHTKMNIFERNP